MKIQVEEKLRENRGNPTGKNKILEFAQREIVYVPKLKNLPLVKSINACLLMQQLDFRFHHYPDGFYKFQAPCENQYAYKEDDSWKEELGMSVDMFRTAFDQIGVRYKDKKSYNEAFDKFQGKYYCSYYNKVTRKTYYYRNHQLVDHDLDTLFLGDGQSQSIEIDYVSPVEVDIPNPESTKNTTKKTTSKKRDKNTPSSNESSKNEERIKPSFINKDFTLTRDMRLWAARKALMVDIEEATGKFNDYYLSNLKKSGDWVSEWRNWMRREAEYEVKRSRDDWYETCRYGDSNCAQYDICEEMNQMYKNSKQPLSKTELKGGCKKICVNGDNQYLFLMEERLCQLDRNYLTNY